LLHPPQGCPALTIDAASIGAMLHPHRFTASVRFRAAFAALLIAVPALLWQSSSWAQATPELPPQTVLAPGLYLFQTRTRDGSCNDAQRTGYVTSAVATLDGVPGSRTMTMQLLNSKYWPTWTLSIALDGAIAGSANMNGAKDDQAGSSHFELRAKKERYQGTGARSYNSIADGKPTRCTLNYDALLKPL
jgi:hypothetical protein